MQQLLTIQNLTYLAGLALVMVGTFGGGIEVKEIKIPTLPMPSRVLSLSLGIVFLAFGLTYPKLFPPDPAPQNSAQSVQSSLPAPVIETKKEQKPDPWLGAIIQNHVMTISDVKRVLRHVGTYSGPINDDADDAYKQAVADFQAAQQIKVDTYVGPETYLKLRDAWPEYFEASKPAKTSQ